MNKVYEYKMAMISIFEEKYGWSEFQAQKAIKDYDFQNVIKKCNYVALHDDPEIWVDEIYNWVNNKHQLLEM